jgi:hypothetical protein
MYTPVSSGSDFLFKLMFGGFQSINHLLSRVLHTEEDCVRLTPGFCGPHHQYNYL